MVLWDTATGKELRRIAHDKGEPHSVIFHPDGKTLLSLDWDRKIHVWDKETGNKLRDLKHEGKAAPLAFFARRQAVRFWQLLEALA